MVRERRREMGGREGMFFSFCYFFTLSVERRDEGEKRVCDVGSWLTGGEMAMMKMWGSFATS